MAHSFDRSVADPYSLAAHEVEENMTSGTWAIAADAETQLNDVLSNAIVNAIGDVASAAFRLGVNDKDRLRGLAKAIGRAAEPVLLAYQGEVAAEPALAALENDPRLPDLPEQDRIQLEREIAKTRELETVITEARRLPDLLDLAGSLGLYVADEVAESGETVMTTHPTSSQTR